MAWSLLSLSVCLMLSWTNVRQDWTWAGPGLKGAEAVVAEQDKPEASGVVLVVVVVVV